MLAKHIKYKEIFGNNILKINIEKTNNEDTIVSIYIKYIIYTSHNTNRIN